MSGRDEEIRELVAQLDALMARARPIVDELTARARGKDPLVDGEDGAEAQEVLDETLRTVGRPGTGR